MVVPKDNIIKQYKAMEIENEKMWLFKTTTEPVKVGALGMIKKETDKYINKILSRTSNYEIKELHFAELPISFGSYYQCE